MSRRSAAGCPSSSFSPSTMLREVEHFIKSAISCRSPENDAAALGAVHAFVSQKPADVPELESTLREIYETMMTIGSLDLFVEILYIIRDHLTVESIGRVWWDLVLQPALRREHMSRSCIKHAIGVTMVVLHEGESAFRRRLVQLYILGVPSLNSADEAIDNVSMNAEERAQMSRWKSSLIDILTEDATKHPTVRSSSMSGSTNSQMCSFSSRKSTTSFSLQKLDFL
jgi:hypothetical protein